MGEDETHSNLLEEVSRKKSLYLHSLCWKKCSTGPSLQVGVRESYVSYEFGEGWWLEPLKPRLKITVVPRFDNTELIKGYSKTLIGRCMNPHKQEIKNLLYMLPRVWHVEGKVARVDLGLGRFQIDFDEEKDILEVLMGPFHFDYWRLSVVRWEPVMDPNYPSDITFWVRVLGVPF
ncbi:unnamed protein product [Microthlaspi erraticum]|uniref:DUF4283 domain-containing protein n=1 Tax=Microthlaspi erraticum TaxID=1685480 RepID=A0A6D2HTV8_9BRAS|nr:unnamed protein product [Microthlaspi erraticum]